MDLIKRKIVNRAQSAELFDDVLVKMHHQICNGAERNGSMLNGITVFQRLRARTCVYNYHQDLLEWRTDNHCDFLRTKEVVRVPSVIQSTHDQKQTIVGIV